MIGSGADRVINQTPHVNQFIADVTFDAMPIVLQPFLQTVEGIGKWILRAFASGAVAGDKFLVAESMFLRWIFGVVVGIVDLIEFPTNFFEEGFLELAGDADAHFFVVAVFDDFGAGIFVGEDHAVFPDEFVID